MFRWSLPAAALVCAVFAAPAHATEFAWSPAGQLSQPRTAAASAVLSDGRVLLAGGWQLPAQKDVAAVDLYDPRTQTWAPGPPLLEPRRNASAVTLRDGRVLLVGGEADADQHIAEIFDPGAGTWGRVASSIAPHVATQGFVLDDGRVLFLGGGWSFGRGGEIYDPATDTWRLTAESHEVGGAAMPVVRLRDGRFLVVGNKSVSAEGFGYELPLAEIYDAARDTWSVVAPPQHAGEGSAAALLPDGRVLLAGGRPGGGPAGPLDATAQRSSEIFDPATESWSPTGDLNRPRAYGSAFVTLADGRLATVGGSWATFTGPLGQRRLAEVFYESTAEVYDVATGTWLETPPMEQPRSGPVAVPLADGSMLVTGGVIGAGNTVTDTAERLAPRVTPPAVVAPPPPAAPAPAPAPAPRKPGTLRFAEPPKRLTVTRTRTLVIKVWCSSNGAACADRLVLRGRGRVLAQRDVKIPAGDEVKVRVKLGAKARRALRHRTTQVTVTLRRQGTKVRVSVRG